MSRQPSRQRARASLLAPHLLLAAAVLLTLPQALAAQEYSLFDRFSVRVGASGNSLDTSVRLDSKTLGIGTKIDFEDDVDLDSAKTTPDVDIHWHFRRRQELSLYWSDLDRSSGTVAAKEVRFGDLVVPLEGHVLVGFDITTYRLGYTYYPMYKDRLAVGVGGGIRVLDITVALALEVLPGEQPPSVVSEAAEVTGPLPYVGAEVRYGVSPRWRFTANGGLLDVTVSGISGYQGIVNAEIENLVGDHFSWGFAANYSTVSVDAEKERFLGSADLKIGFLRIFVKGRL